MFDFWHKNGNTDEEFPNRAGKSRLWRRLGKPRCLLCGERISLGEGYYQKNGFPYCRSCMEVIDTDLLIRICETDRQKWLESMGFLYLER